MKKNVIKATGYIFILSVIAKIIGFLKSMIQAAYFGATESTDVYNMASGIVQNIVYMLSTSLAVIFVPLYIQRKAESGEKNAKQFASKTITALLICSAIMVILLELTASGFMRLAAPAYDEGLLSEAVMYFRVMAVGYIFALMSDLYQNLLNAEKIYGFSALTSIINSAVLMILIIFTSGKIGIWALVFSLPVSYLCQFLILYTKGKKYGNIYFKQKVFDPTLEIMFIQALPVLAGQATVEINQVVDRALLSSLETGDVTAVSYAAVLYQFVVHIISIPVSTVMFTELSIAGAKRNLDYIKNSLSEIYKIIVEISIPIMIIVCFLCEDIVNVIYGRGNFDLCAIVNTALGLSGYIFCLIPEIIKSVLTKAYYALNDTRHPMVIGILEVVLNITLSVILSRYFGLIGIVAATAIAGIVFMVVMINDFNFTHIRVPVNICKNYWKIFISAITSIYVFGRIRNTINGVGFFVLILKMIIIFMAYGMMLLILRDSTVIKIIDYFYKQREKRKK